MPEKEKNKSGLDTYLKFGAKPIKELRGKNITDIKDPMILTGATWEVQLTARLTTDELEQLHKVVQKFVTSIEKKYDTKKNK